MASVKSWSENRHTITISHGVKKGADGKPKQDLDYIPFEGTKVEALFEANRLETLKKAGRIITTFKPLLEKWLAERKNDVETDRGLTQNSYETYYYHVQKLIIAIGDVNLQGTTARQLMKLLDVALAKLSRKYQAEIYITLRLVIRYAVGEGLMKDISVGLKAPAIRRKREKKVVPKEDIPRVLKALEHLKWYLLFRLIIIFGLRISEGLALRWSVVDLVAGRIKIVDAVSIRHRSMNGGTKTEASERWQPLDPVTLQMLRELFNEQKKQPTPIKGQDLIFRTKAGRPLHYGTLNRSLTRALKKAGFDRYTPHEFRHTYITHLKRSGLSEQEVLDAAGHVCRQSSQPYTHSSRQGKNLLTELSIDESLGEGYAGCHNSQ